MPPAPFSDLRFRKRRVLVGSFAVGIVLLLAGLWRWPPESHRFRNSRRTVSDGHYGPSDPDFELRRARSSPLLAVGDYVSSMAILLFGIVYWSHGASAGFRLRDLLGRKWKEAGWLRLVLLLHSGACFYACGVCLSLAYSLVSEA
jgi:hypothetical protein